MLELRPKVLFKSKNKTTWPLLDIKEWQKIASINGQVWLIRQKRFQGDTFHIQEH
jgi:hypothetical protein